MVEEGALENTGSLRNSGDASPEARLGMALWGCACDVEGLRSLKSASKSVVGAEEAPADKQSNL